MKAYKVNHTSIEKHTNYPFVTATGSDTAKHNASWETYFRNRYDCSQIDLNDPTIARKVYYGGRGILTIDELDETFPLN